MVLSMLPFIGIFFKKIHAWWHKNSNHKCHEDHCHSHHVEHIEELDKFDPYLDWDEVSLELIKERFGDQIFELLQTNYQMSCGHTIIHDSEVPEPDEFKWYVNSAGQVKAVLEKDFIL